MVRRLFFLILSLCLALSLGVCAEEITTQDEATVEEDENSWGYISDEEFAKRPAPTEFPPLEIVGGNKIHIGDLWQGQIKYFKVALKNTSTQKWKIQEIEASCSCTSVDGIPGGRFLKPGEVWEMDVKVDSSKIDLGDFTRTITIVPLDFKRVDIEICGKVCRFYRTLPSKPVMNFGFVRSPETKWKASIEVIGIDSGKDVLKLGKLPSKSEIEFTKEEISPGYWKITATPRNTLYFNSNYAKRVIIPVEEPKNCPPIVLALVGKIGVPFEFSPRGVEVESKYLDGDNPLELSTQLGFDPTASTPSGNAIAERNRERLETMYMESVDWESLLEKLDVRCPGGVTVEKVFTRYGIRLDFKISKDVFAEDNVVEIPAYAYDHVLATFKLKKKE